MIHTGDALEVLKTLPDESVHCVVTSPPYNRGYWNQVKNRRKIDAWNKAEIIYGDFNDNVLPEIYEAEQRKVLSELIRVIKLDGSIFYNHKALIYKHRLVYPSWVFDYNVRQQIIWDRGSSPSVDPIRWLPVTEYVFWITKTATQPKFLGWKGRNKTEVWRISPKQQKDHPAPFPEELVEECLLATTDTNDLVLDPYMGIGTTALVARKLGRSFIGIELNPAYVEIADKRLQEIQPSLLTPTGNI